MSSPVSVRLMRPEDVESVVAIHEASFPDYFVTRLGRPFLRHLYLATLDEISLVAVAGDQVLGYHLTFTRPTGVFGRLLLRHGWRFARLAWPVALRSRHHVRRLLLAPLKPLQARQPGHAAISMYTAVAEAGRGQGVAKKLLYQLVAEAAARGIPAVRGENEDDPRLCALYEKVGFDVIGSKRSLDGEEKVVTHAAIPESVRLLGADLPPALWRDATAVPPPLAPALAERQA